MQSQILTSSSNKFIYIDRVDDLFKLAASMKCNTFIMNPFEGVLYGSYEEPYSIIETNVPFRVCDDIFIFTSNLFQSTRSKEIINKYKTFFYIPEAPQFLFPECMRAKLMNNGIAIDWDYYILRDALTGEPLEDYICSQLPDSMFSINGLIASLSGYKQSMSNGTYYQNIVFDDCQKHPVIMDVIQSKVSQGRKLMVLEQGDKKFAFYAFKGLLGPLTRQDKLVIYIAENIFIPKKFIATFTVAKKSKLGIPEVTLQFISTHVPMINLV